MAYSAAGNPPAGAWSSGLFDCFSDISGCCLTIFCPCITFGRIANIVDQGATSCCVSGTLYFLLSALTGGQPSLLTGGLSCLYSCCYRSRLRTQHGLPEGPCNCPDCCVHFWCEPCALCQEYRELKARGFDMSKGWHGNMERKGATAPPQMHPGMSR
ncbi:unnamed protein product [Urochloa humidicola]